MRPDIKRDFFSRQRVRTVIDTSMTSMRKMLDIPELIKPRTAKKQWLCNASEREQLVRLKIMMELAGPFTRDMDRRAGEVPGLRRDTRLLINLLQRMMVGFLETVPDEQRAQLIRNVIDGTYVTGTKPASNIHRRDDTFGQWLSFDDLNVILLALNAQYCTLCPYGDSWAMQQSCPLKKVLDRLGADVHHDGTCAYQLLDVETK